MYWTRALAVAVFLAPAAAFGTAGFFQHGYGLKAKGMGGAGIALPQDALATATNPAGMVWLGNRLDLGLEWFDADRGSTISGNTSGLNRSRDANGVRGFPIPEFGYNRMLDTERSLGVSVYGNGGITRYSSNPFQGGGSTPAGFDFVQGIVAPTFAVKLDANHSVGAALNLVYQQFEARGLERFATGAFSSSPANVTNRGRDHAAGASLRLGWLGRVAPDLTLGATYQTKTWTQKFDRYRGLFADQGSFEAPENFGIGMAWKPGKATLAVDLERINFSKVAGVGNRDDCFLAGTCLLGESGGPGAGWRDVTVLKAGLAYEWDATLTLRGGGAVLRQPIPRDQTVFGVLAPAVSEIHLTLGATWQISPRSELTLGFMHALPNTVRGSGSISGGLMGGGEADLRMRQTSIGISWGLRP